MPDELPDGCGPLTCREVARVLQAHLDGELASGDAATVAAHLGDCHGCDLEAEAYREIKTALRRHPDDLSPATVERLRRYATELSRGDSG